MAKKVVLTLVVIFLVFYLVSQPREAASANDEALRMRAGLRENHRSGTSVRFGIDEAFELPAADGPGLLSTPLRAACCSPGLRARDGRSGRVS